MKRRDLSACFAAAVVSVAVALSPAKAALAVTCAELNGASIPPSAIGLPTTGATVTTSTVAATATLGEYCKALVAIHPVDRSAPDIRAQVNLPAEWNTKAFMQGGGGYNGTIPNTTVNFGNGPLGKPALAQGYATFSSDSGHQANARTSRDGRFAVSAEALHNFAGDALKKTRDSAVYLIEKRYGRRPTRSYFVGGSTGGREALWVVQNTPNDFDGAVSMYPAWNAASLDLQFGRITRAIVAVPRLIATLTPDSNRLPLGRDIWAAATYAHSGIHDGGSPGSTGEESGRTRQRQRVLAERASMHADGFLGQFEDADVQPLLPLRRSELRPAEEVHGPLVAYVDFFR